MAWDPSEPYNDLPRLPPRGVDLESRAVLKATITARAAVAALDQAAILLPNPWVLLNALAARSAGELGDREHRHDDRQAARVRRRTETRAADPATKEALRYRRALFDGVRKVQKGKLTVDIAIDVCRTIKDEKLDLRSKPGTTLRSTATGAVIYTPPVGKDVIRDKLANWEQFLTAHDDLDPLIRCAVQHYQFEAIHPFPDGNGRTGRIVKSLISCSWVDRLSRSST